MIYFWLVDIIGQKCVNEVKNKDESIIYTSNTYPSYIGVVRMAIINNPIYPPARVGYDKRSILSGVKQVWIQFSFS